MNPNQHVNLAKLRKQIKRVAWLRKPSDTLFTNPTPIAEKISQLEKQMMFLTYNENINPVCSHPNWMILRSESRKMCYDCGIYKPIRDEYGKYQR